MTKVKVMKTDKKLRHYNIKEEDPDRVNEPSFAYRSYSEAPKIQSNTPTIHSLKSISYEAFEKIDNKSPFSLEEWAIMLHVSERTLQRYAQKRSNFNTIQSEIILLVEKFVDMGNYMFGRKGFKEWLVSPVFALNHQKPIEFLGSYAGIQENINIIGRIMHGIPS